MATYYEGGSSVAGLYIGAKNITELDKMRHLRGVQPRGWSEGKTWDVVPGAHSPGIRRTLIGPHKGHGSTDLSLHEFGRTPLITPTVTCPNSAKWTECTVKSTRGKDRMSPYYKQTGWPGKEELFARRLFGLRVYGKPGDLDTAFDIIGGGLRSTDEERTMATARRSCWFEKNVAPKASRGGSRDGRAPPPPGRRQSSRRPPRLVAG